MQKDTNVDNQLVEAGKKVIYDENNCPVTAAMKVIGGKWKPILLNCVHQHSPARFGELRKKLKGITQTMLTAQLRELEEAGILHRKIYAEIPPRVEYTLTDFGKTLEPVFQSLADWGSKHLLNKAKINDTVIS